MLSRLVFGAPAASKLEPNPSGVTNVFRNHHQRHADNLPELLRAYASASYGYGRTDGRVLEANSNRKGLEKLESAAKKLADALEKGASPTPRQAQKIQRIVNAARTHYSAKPWNHSKRICAEHLANAVQAAVRGEPVPAPVAPTPPANQAS